MKTSVIGFPRVGKLRELKFATEKYFRNEVTAQQLEATAAQIRKYQWNLQKDNNVDFIPSNDFSFYDLVLDTAVLFNILFHCQCLNIAIFARITSCYGKICINIR